MTNSQRFFICALALGIIAFSIILRSEPNLFANQLLNQFAITPNMFSNLLSNYQYSLIVTLIFAGIFVDYFGSRKVILFGALLALIGNLLFTFGRSTNALLYGRIIIGYAHPFILIGALKLGAEFLTRRHFTFFTGLVFAISLLTPEILKPFIHQQLSLFNLLLSINIGGTLLIAIYLFAYKASDENFNRNISLHKIISILREYKIWLICLLSIIGWLANTFLLNWGAMFLMHVYHLSFQKAFAIISESFIAFGISALVMGAVADLIKQKHFLLILGYFVAGFAFTTLLMSFYFSETWLSIMCYVTAIACSVVIVCYAKAFDYCELSNAGFTFGLVACLTTVGNTAYAYLLTQNLKPLLDKPQINMMSAWVPILLVIPTALFLGGLIAFFLRRPKHLPA